MDDSSVWLIVNSIWYVACQPTSLRREPVTLDVWMWILLQTDFCVWKCLKTTVYLTPVWPRGIHEKHAQRVRLGEMILVQQVLTGNTQSHLGDAVRGLWTLGHKWRHRKPGEGLTDRKTIKWWNWLWFYSSRWWDKSNSYYETKINIVLKMQAVNFGGRTMDIDSGYHQGAWNRSG